jgi:hypothetical protein
MNGWWICRALSTQAHRRINMHRGGATNTLYMTCQRPKIFVFSFLCFGVLVLLN